MQDYGYDEFDHMTLRQGKYWYTDQNTFSAVFANNIASNVMDGGQPKNWQHDAEGNVTSEGVLTHSFNAVGRQVKSSYPVAVGVYDSFYYDGAGRLVSQTHTSTATGEPMGDSTYYLWSTVLKENLAQIRIEGRQYYGDRQNYYRDVFIYVNGQQVAVRKYDQDLILNQPSLNSAVYWAHRDPLNTMALEGVMGGSHTPYSIDPLGVEVQAANQGAINAYWDSSPDPNNPPEGFYQDSGGNPGTYGFSAPNPGNWGIGCYVDNIQVQCERAFRTHYNDSGYISNFNITGGMGWQGTAMASTLLNARFEPKLTPDPNGETWTLSKELKGGEPFGLFAASFLMQDQGQKSGGQQSGSSTSEPPVPSNCRGWDHDLPIYISFAKEALGTTFKRFPNMLSNQEWRVEPKEGLSEKATIEAFERAGWKKYRNYNPEHFGGSDYERYYDGAWYHLTIGYGMRPATLLEGGQFSWWPEKYKGKNGDVYDSSQPPPWITLHCELNFRPSSFEHFDDHMKRKYGISPAEVLKQLLVPIWRRKIGI